MYELHLFAPIQLFPLFICIFGRVIMLCAQKIQIYYQMSLESETGKFKAGGNLSNSRILLELQQTTEREQNLRKINTELTKIIQQQNSSETNSQLSLIQKLNQMEISHNQEIKSLKLQIHLIQAQSGFQIQALKSKLEEANYQAELAEREVNQIKQYIEKSQRQKESLEMRTKKYEKMIENQETLIDEYRKNIDEQIKLEKEVIKVMYAEKQLQNKRKFEQALKYMQENYDRKLKKAQQKKAKKQYNNQLQMLKNYCRNKVRGESKENYHEEQKKGVSGYSTLAK